ncbi:MAG TPA: hypothetical protein VGB59_10795 [Allosphingosinicella sp.]|jgi:hypothetical protein
MAIKLPRPRDGWRVFAGEVGVIVLGVLIALFAEQLVSEVNWNRDVGEFRRAANEEIATNLHAYRLRVRQSGCVRRRIAELERWRDGALARGGATEPLQGEIGRPAIYSIRHATWDSRGDTAAHMPLEDRLNYAEVYAVISANYQQMLEEREAWRSLAAFNGLRQLDTAGAMRLNELLFRAKSIDTIVSGNLRQAVDFGARLGVKPEPGRRGAYFLPPDPALCRSLLAARTT